MDQELLKELETLFTTKPEAWEFLKCWTAYIECIDDLVDEPKDINLINKTAALGMLVYSTPYWIKNVQSLYLVARLIHFTYFDIVEWELSDEEWKRRDAKALSHCGYNMLFALLLLEFGDEAYQKFSVRVREFAHLKHLNDL